MAEVYWSWSAEIKPGELANFKALAKHWNKIAATDPGTLFNAWVISEDGQSVQVNQRFTNAATAFAQFDVNECWHKLDDHVNPTSMFVCGDYGKTLDFLREHGAVFMETI